MEKFDVSVGKFTLESLTTGMYSDARIVYREYIQNSVDSLENAVELNIIKHDEMRINIVADSINNHIFIEDNGTGVESEQAASVLLNIGDSTKRSNNNRGFRGIGRLGGMSYCDKLVFSTSAKGEATATRISFDCMELRRLMLPGMEEHEDLVSLLKKITTIEYLKEEEEAHYFIVDLFGVDETTGLLEGDKIRTYIEEVAPLPYKKSQFYWCSEIEKYMADRGYIIEEFPIFFGTNIANKKPLYKLNRNRFKSNRSKRESDEIESLELFEIIIDDELYAVGWYGNCNWLGTMSDLEMAGLRIRKGNILIGDRTTLNPIFDNQSRFNAWVQGELFVLKDDLIPNARRDDFEKNEAYNKLINKMMKEIGKPLISKIRAASVERNDAVGKTIRNINITLKDAQKELDEGYNSKIDKEAAIQTIDDIEKVLEGLPKNISDERKEIKRELKNKADILKSKIEDSSHYKMDELGVSLDRKSKKILYIVSEVLSEKLSKELADLIIEGIKEKLRER